MNGYSIYFDEQDFRELLEYSLWKFKNRTNSNFNLREASDLIAIAQKEKADLLKRKANQERLQDMMGQQRDSVGTLPDRDADRILRELNKPEQDYVAEAKEQALRYCQSRNAGSTPKAFDADDAEQVSIRNGTLSWIESKRKKNWFKRDVKNKG